MKQIIDLQKEIAHACFMGRCAQHKTLEVFAKECDINVNTLAKFEKTGRCKTDTLEKILSKLEIKLFIA